MSQRMSRTALILRELEEEIQAIESFRSQEHKLASHMEEKERIEAHLCSVRLELQRAQNHYVNSKSNRLQKDMEKEIEELKRQLKQLDQVIAPLAQASSELNNPIWGLLLRAGNDKSYLAYQMERYADIYTSRVSNFLAATPFAYLRSPKGSLPHDV